MQMYFKKGETVRGEVGQMRLSGLGVKTVPGSAVAGREVPQQVEAEPDKAVSAWSASQQA